MPLTRKGKKIKRAMHQQYGSKKGEKVFYASRNKGNITGVDEMNLVERILDRLEEQLKPKPHLPR